MKVINKMEKRLSFEKEFQEVLEKNRNINKELDKNIENFKNSKKRKIIKK